MKPEAAKALRVPLPTLDPGRSVWALPPETAHYVVDVRRLGEGDALVVFDAAGVEAPAILRGGPGGWLAEQAGPLSRGSTGSALTLCYALPKGDKLESVLRQVTELGIGEIVLMHTRRAVVRLDKGRAEKKRARWARILVEAARQSGRADVPTLRGPMSLAEALELTSGAQWRAICHPGPGASGWPDDALSGSGVIFVGPEGGFSEEEVLQSARGGVRHLDLGPLVLRTETAAVVASALALDRMGALSPRAAEQPS